MIIVDGPQTEEPTEVSDGAQVEKDQANGNPELEPGGESLPNGGGEDQETGGETQPMEREVSETEENSKPDPFIELKQGIEEKFKALEGLPLEGLKA